MDQVCSLRLPPEQEQVLMRMAQRASDDGTHCHPGIAELVERTGRPERTVRRIISELEQAGLITALAYRHGGRGKATEWRICLKTMPSVAAYSMEETLPPVAENPATDGTLSEETLPPVAENPATGGPPIDQEDQEIRKIKKDQVVRASRGTARKPKTVKQLSEDGVGRLVADYAERLGGEREVRERIEEALANDAAKKWTDMYLYVRGWLRRDADKTRPTNGLANGRANGHGPPVSAAAERFRGVGTSFAESSP